MTKDKTPADVKEIERWRAIDTGGVIACESAGRTEYSRTAHCKACALVDVITKYGGDTDLRGLHRYGSCYQFLAVVVRQSRDKQVDEATTEGD